MYKQMILIVFLLSLVGCDWDIRVSDSVHTIRHVVTVEVPLEILEQCQVYTDELARAECYEEVTQEFLDVVKGLTDIANGSTNGTDK